MRAGPVVLVLVLLWLVTVAASVLLAQAVEGPRTLDTGFRRLDIFFGWQLAALALALLAALVAWVGRPRPHALRLAGFAPLALTLLVVAGVALWVRFAPVPVPDQPPTPRAATAVPAPAPSQ